MQLRAASAGCQAVSGLGSGLGGPFSGLVAYQASTRAFCCLIRNMIEEPCTHHGSQGSEILDQSGFFGETAACRMLVMPPARYFHIQDTCRWKSRRCADVTFCPPQPQLSSAHVNAPRPLAKAHPVAVQFTGAAPPSDSTSSRIVHARLLTSHRIAMSLWMYAARLDDVSLQP